MDVMKSFNDLFLVNNCHENSQSIIHQIFSSCGGIWNTYKKFSHFGAIFLKIVSNSADHLFCDLIWRHFFVISRHESRVSRMQLLLPQLNRLHRLWTFCVTCHQHDQYLHRECFVHHSNKPLILFLSALDLLKLFLYLVARNEDKLQWLVICP